MSEAIQAVTCTVNNDVPENAGETRPVLGLCDTHMDGRTTRNRSTADELDSLRLRRVTNSE